MGTLLLVIAAVLFIAAILVLVAALRRPKMPRTGRQDPLAFAAATSQFGPRQLGPGAIVSHGGIDYVVRGSATYRQGPFVWWEHLLEGGDQPVWFSVEEDEGRLELAMWTARKDLRLQPDRRHVIDGVTYEQTERGQAGYTTEGTTGLPPAGDMDFVDYAADGETGLLSLERWAPDMPWEASIGTSVSPGELTVYPAPPPAGD